MKQIIEIKSFRRDLKLAKKRNKDLHKLSSIIRQLASSIKLSHAHKQHKLIGNYSGMLECHIETNWLLIYKITEDSLILYRTGTHTDLFL